MEFSPSSEASLSSRSLEEDEDREDNSSVEYFKEEKENGGMVDMEDGNLQERIAAMKNTLQEFQELKTAYRWVNNLAMVGENLLFLVRWWW